jgi:hypothetical protein
MLFLMDLMACTNPIVREMDQNKGRVLLSRRDTYRTE